MPSVAELAIVVGSPTAQSTSTVENASIGSSDGDCRSLYHTAQFYGMNCNSSLSHLQVRVRARYGLVTHLRGRY